MATKAKVNARQEDAGKLLQQNVAPATITAILISRYKISRATAYRDVEAAQIVIEQAQRQNPDLGTQLGDRIDGESLVGMMESLLLEAYAQGDIKQTFQALNAVEKARRMTGLGHAEAAHKEQQSSKPS